MSRKDYIPRHEAPEVEEPKKTFLGSAGCLGALFVLFGSVALILVAFYSAWNYSEEMRLPGYHEFDGCLVEVKNVLFSERIKLVIETEGRRLILPPMPPPVEEGDGNPLLENGTCMSGHVRIHRNFLAEVEMLIEGKHYYFDQDIGWVVRGEVPSPLEIEPSLQKE